MHLGKYTVEKHVCKPQTKELKVMLIKLLRNSIYSLNIVECCIPNNKVYYKSMIFIFLSLQGNRLCTRLGWDAVISWTLMEVDESQK